MINLNLLLGGLFYAKGGMILATAFIGWVDANVGATPQKRGEPGVAAGGDIHKLIQTWTKKTTDGNGTIYFIAGVPADGLISELKLMNDALTGATSADVGLFEMDPSLQNLGGANQTAATYYAGAPAAGAIPSIATPKIDAGAIYMSAVSIASGNAITAPLDLINSSSSNIATQTVTAATNPGLLILNYKVWDLLGWGVLNDPKWKADSYCLGLRLNTAGAAAGNFAVACSWIQG